RPDRQEVEEAGLLDDADDHHHAEQQEDDVPVDALVFGVEDVAAGGEPEQRHQTRRDKDNGDLVCPLCCDEIERDDEYRQREHRCQHGAVWIQSLGPATARLVSNRSRVTAPTRRPSRSTTAMRGLLLLAIRLAISSRVASGATVAGLATGFGRQSPTVSLPGPCQNRSAWISSTVRTRAGSSR